MPSCPTHGPWDDLQGKVTSCPTCTTVRSPAASSRRATVSTVSTTSRSHMRSARIRLLTPSGARPRDSVRLAADGEPVTAAAPIQAAPDHWQPRKRTVVASPAVPPGSADYEVMEVLGRGGMGEVLAAKQVALDRTIAIKRLAEPAATIKALAGFHAEAKLTGSLDHPNIIPVHDLGIDQDGRPFYAMKRVRGAIWSERFHELSLDENLEILVRVCDAIAFAHANGIIHRDLKPANVMIGSYGEVLVMDWGMAVHIAELRQDTGPDRLTCGTPAYMAPEMARAENSIIGPCSDIYLLGGIMFELLTGLPPHPGEDLYTCLGNAANNVLEPGLGDDELAGIARKALAHEPEARHKEVKDLQNALRAHRIHAQSEVLCSDAERTLAAARTQSRYDLFASAIAGFLQSLALWEDHHRARTGARDAFRAFAEHALATGDVDLAASLLDNEALAGTEDREELAQRVRKVRRERASIRSRMRLLTYTSLTAVIVVLAVTAIALISARNQHTTLLRAIRERDAAEMRLAAIEQRPLSAAVSEDFAGDRLPESLRILQGRWVLAAGELRAEGTTTAVAELVNAGSGPLRLGFDLVESRNLAVVFGMERGDLLEPALRATVVGFDAGVCTIARAGMELKRERLATPVPGLPQHIRIEWSGGALTIVADGRMVARVAEAATPRPRLALAADSGTVIDNLRLDRLAEAAPLRTER